MALELHSFFKMCAISFHFSHYLGDSTVWFGGYVKKGKAGFLSSASLNYVGGKTIAIFIQNNGL